MSKKDLIKDKSMELFIEKGFHGTSTKMISDATGVSNGAIFHHFETKECIARAIYLDIKEEMSEFLKETLDNECCFRNFVESHWHKTIEWSLNHPRKKEFLNIFSNTPMIKCCSNDKQRLYGSIFAKIQKAIDDKEIIINDIEYYMFNFAAVTNGVLNYLNLKPEKNNKEFLDMAFNSYWRSIANF